MCECEYCEREKATKKAAKEAATETAEDATDKIMDCSRTGNIEEFYKEIGKHPQVLQDIDKIQFVSTQLHEAAAHGKTAMAVEIMNLMPSFGKKLNPECLTPLHVAVERGRTDTAKALVKADKQLVLVKGKHGQTPLHYAATKPIPDRCAELDMDRLLVSFLLACPQSIDVLNNRLQTVVHVACEHRRFNAVHLLVNWLVTRQTESLLMETDEDGNTALHLAAKHCRSTDMNVLNQIKDIVLINKLNNDGKTPLDLASTPEARKALEKKGGMKGEEVGPKLTKFNYLSLKKGSTWAEVFVVAYCSLTKQLTMEMRNTILVVAVLISTATYQAVLAPPGGVYQGETGVTTTNKVVAAAPNAAPKKVYEAGTMVMQGANYIQFMPTNTLAFVVSIVIIIFVLPTRYFMMILQSTLIFMCASYLLALRFISASNSVSTVMFYLSIWAISGSYLLKTMYYVVRALYAGDVWWLRRLGVMLNNYNDRLELGKSDDLRYDDMSYISQMKAQYKILNKN